MTNVNVQELQRLLDQIYEGYEEGEDVKSIEGLLIQKKNGDWVTIMVSDRMMVVKVDYCCWCGEKLTDKHNQHSH